MRIITIRKRKSDISKRVTVVRRIVVLYGRGCGMWERGEVPDGLQIVLGFSDGDLGYLSLRIRHFFAVKSCEHSFTVTASLFVG